VKQQAIAVVARQQVLELLPPEEAARRDHLDAIIRSGLKTFVEVGVALCEVRDRRLYRSTHGSFLAYCVEQWKMSEAQATRLISSARVVLALPIGKGPATESQARELTALEPEEAAIVWEVVRSTADAKKGVTAAHVRSVAAVLKTILAAGAIDDGTGEMLPWDDLDPNHQRALLEANLAEETYERLQRQKAHVSHNSGDSEWFTPPEIITATTKVLGAIDLDPASSAAANEVVGAGTFYSASDDGLADTAPWHGRVFMNPPYRTSLVVPFCARLVREYHAGAVSQAVVLVNNATETEWFQQLLSAASGVCLPAGRIRFWHPEKKTASPLQGQAILYLGKRARTFAGQFASFGSCLARVE